ncbi:hypothetical protein ACJMK2_035291 [Sinanodonta woodiana]|uniref:PID domain-containing protein n=1 Tax=Sinanodonta woodiana TaxID=1069815 RepID=A0ABD3WUE9_SINWO
MSVSDPLLKKLKGHILELRSRSETVRDGHPRLVSLCHTLECIFSKGLKKSSSWFKKSGYWAWIVKIPILTANQRINPILMMTIDSVKECKKTQSSLGKGRHFIRMSLVKRVLTVPVQILAKDKQLANTWYAENESILGDEILIEILQSLLFELTEVTFSLQLHNASFLDICWELPVYKEYELVPCNDLGINIQTCDGYPVVVSVEPNSVSAEDDKIVPGDVLDEMCGKTLKGSGKGMVQILFSEVRGYPVYISVMKFYDAEGNIFEPIGCLLRQLGVEPDRKKVDIGMEEETHFGPDRMPPEAILEEDEADEVPVHHTENRATYVVKYLGSMALGKDGRVDRIEDGVGFALSHCNEIKDVVIELGEKEITVSSKDTGEVLFQYLFTEISSCGRRIDAKEYFAFNAGETYCSFAQNFQCHVFQASGEEEVRVILCTIAQGFERTHLMT